MTNVNCCLKFEKLYVTVTYCRYSLFESEAEWYTKFVKLAEY